MEDSGAAQDGAGQHVNNHGGGRGRGGNGGRNSDNHCQGVCQTRAVDGLQLTMPTPPAQPDDEASPCDFEVWKIKHKTFHDCTRVFTDFNAGLCSIVLGQSSEALLSNVQSSAGDNHSECHEQHRGVS